MKGNWQVHNHSKKFYQNSLRNWAKMEKDRQFEQCNLQSQSNGFI